ncbi:MAG: hypothetical protein J6W76_06110, partial [Spirochaetales bacterium]|nr:hypothetical protein [Spirochaetales bacterium]
IASDYESFSEESTDKFNALRSDYTTLNDNLTQMKLKIDQDVGAKIADGKKKLDDEYKLLQDELDNLYKQEIDNAQRRYNDTRAELDNCMADYKKNAQSLNQTLKQIDKEYTGKYLEHTSFLEKKINQIKLNVDDFERKTKIFDDANKLKEKLTADMEEMKDLIRTLRSDKDKINDIEKQIREIESLAKSTVDKSSAITAERKKLDNMSSVLTQLKDQFDATTEKFSDLKIQGDIAQRLNEKIADTNERYEKMEKVFRSLDETEQTLKTVYDKMDILNKSFTDYNHRADAFDQRLIDLDSRQQTYQQKFNSFEKESQLILRSEQDINNVMDQFKQLDILQQSIIRRTEEANRINTRVNEAMVKYNKIETEMDDKIRVMQALLNDAEQTPAIKNAMMPGDDQQDAAMRLQRQGFTIDQIANTLHISGQEVEMLLGSDDSASRRRF